MESILTAFVTTLVKGLLKNVDPKLVDVLVSKLIMIGFTASDPERVMAEVNLALADLDAGKLPGTGFIG